MKFFLNDEIVEIKNRKPTLAFAEKSPTESQNLSYKWHQV